MYNQVIPISRAEVDVLALEYFKKICGFNRGEEKDQRMLEQGIKIKEKIQNRVDLKAIVSFFSGDTMKNNIVVLDGIAFECNAFQCFSPKHMKGIYAYILTAGVFELCDEDSGLDQLYTDIWGTAYVNSGLELLRKYVEKDIYRIYNDKQEKTDATEVPITVLDSFGPGFYGMDVDQVSKFFVLLDGDKIGVKVRSHHLIIPEKSCVGFFIAVDDQTGLLLSDCKSCRAEYKNCAFCRAVIKKTK